MLSLEKPFYKEEIKPWNDTSNEFVVKAITSKNLFE